MSIKFYSGSSLQSKRLSNNNWLCANVKLHFFPGVGFKFFSLSNQIKKVLEFFFTEQKTLIYFPEEGPSNFFPEEGPSKQGWHISFLIYRILINISIFFNVGYRIGLKLQTLKYRISADLKISDIA